MSVSRRLFPVMFAVVCSLAWGSSAFAQGLKLSSQKGDSNIPIDVYADDGIEWMQNEKVFIARGNAKAVRDGVAVTGDMLKAYYRETASGDNEVFRLDADGSVTIASATENVTGDSATYNVDDAALMVYGSPARLVTPTDTIVAYDRLEYWENTGRAVARGRAAAVHEDKRIEADFLEAYFAENAQQKSELKSAYAKGSVILTTVQDVVTGDEGNYTAETGQAIMSGRVKLTRGNNQLNGGYAVVNMQTGVSRLYAAPPGTESGSRVQGVFVPGEGQKENSPRSPAAEPGVPSPQQSRAKPDAKPQQPVKKTTEESVKKPSSSTTPSQRQ